MQALYQLGFIGLGASLCSGLRLASLGNLRANNTRALT